MRRGDEAHRFVGGLKWSASPGRRRRGRACLLTGQCQYRASRRNRRTIVRRRAPVRHRDVPRVATCQGRVRLQRELLLRMLEEMDGVASAKSLLAKSTLSSGYTELWLRGRLDITVEGRVQQALPRPIQRTRPCYRSAKANQVRLDPSQCEQRRGLRKRAASIRQRRTMDSTPARRPPTGCQSSTVRRGDPHRSQTPTPQFVFV